MGRRASKSGSWKETRDAYRNSRTASRRRRASCSRRPWSRRRTSGSREYHTWERHGRIYPGTGRRHSHSPPAVRIDTSMSYPYAATRPPRAAPSLPFGWGAVTVLLIGALFTIVGIVIILYAFFGFLMGTIGAATSSSFSVMSFFQSFFGAIIQFV